MDEAIITVTVTDDDSGQDVAQIATTVVNVPPQLVDLHLTEAVDENGFVALTGTIVDPGTLDTFTLVINWGDGSIEEINLGRDQRNFNIQHQYLDDNPTNTAQDEVVVGLTLTDDDTGAATAALTTLVKNVAPTLEDVQITETVDENGFATLTGNIIDPGTLDTFTLLIHWGDGSVEEVNLGRDERNFSVQHQYLDDDPTDTAQDEVTVSLTLTDDDTVQLRIRKS